MSGVNGVNGVDDGGAIEQITAMLRDANSVVFFGGAGVSTESGIPDFRSADGLYNTKYAYPPETMLSHSFFAAHTEEFFRFYRDKMIYRGAQPNPAHLALAELEAMGKLKAVITQNIDGLHTLAGSKRVLELHGSVYRNYCTRCRAPFPLDAILQAEGVPKCGCGGVIKPDVVLYEEGLDPQVLQDSARAIEDADALIIGGTSLNVYPAAGLIRYYGGGKLILINKSATSCDARANLGVRESIGEVLRAAVAALTG